MSNIIITPGHKTTEFWLTAALCIVGVILMAQGQEELGTALLAAGGISYSASRGLAKRGS